MRDQFPRSIAELKLIIGGKKEPTKRPRRSRQLFQHSLQASIAHDKYPGEWVLMYGYKTIDHHLSAERIVQLRWRMRATLDVSKSQTGLVVIKPVPKKKPRSKPF